MRRSARAALRWLLVAGLATLAGCSREAGEPGPRRPLAYTDEQAEASHERMRTILGKVAKTSRRTHPFHNVVELRQLRQRAKTIREGQAATPTERWKLHLDLGKAELRFGETQAAIDNFDQAYRLLPEVDFEEAREKRLIRAVEDAASFFPNHTTLFLGVSHLRRGELENCCDRHGPESCILPLQGGGVHTLQSGSREAIRYLLEVLRNRPATPNFNETLTCEKAALWLLNIAYMTLGEHPEGVPEEYRIDLRKLYASEVEGFPRFPNVLPELGLDTFNLAGSCVVDDLDGDEYLDVAICTWDAGGQMRLFRNERDGSFTDRTDAAGLTGFLGGLNMVQADHDDDGDTDLLVLRGCWQAQYGQIPNSLLSNRGDGTFRDVAFAAGLGEVHYPTKVGAWSDYDLDGDLDLYIGNEATSAMRAPGQLFRNRGDGTFVDVAAEAGVADLVFAMGAVWGDYDGDRWPDLYVSTGSSDLLSLHSIGGPNLLYHNRGDGTFEEVAEELGVTKSGPSFPCWFWDYDNDGALDIYVSCSSGPIGVLASDIRFESNRLYRGDGRGGFTEVSAEVGLTFPAQPMGANFGDLNNDGWLDFYLATGNMQFFELRPSVMFLNLQGERFTNVTLEGGFGHLQKGHGVSFADLDNDGDQDVWAQLGGGFLGDEFSDALFENPGFGNGFLAVELEGRRSNRSGIGARIRVDVVEDGVRRSIHRQVDSGGSFGANPLRQSIGIGQAERIETLEVYWPASDTRQTFHDLEPGRFLKVVEGEDRLRTLDLQPFRLGSGR